MAGLRVLAARNARYLSVPSIRCLHTVADTFPPSIQKWSHPPSSAQISDSDIKRLAESPRRPLTLADLVKCAEIILHLL
jgi:hypothetical protein